MAVAGHARKPRHPRNDRQRGRIADCHVVRAVRSHAESPQRETGEARAFVEHHVEVLNGMGLGLRGAMDVHELREDVLVLVVLQIFPCRLRCHCTRCSLGWKVAVAPPAYPGKPSAPMTPPPSSPAISATVPQK